jgi:TRAP-type C4-dicarboxylate transport system permease large subunit
VDLDPALLTAFIIVGGVLLGWFTPTESAAVAVIYTTSSRSSSIAR